MTVAPASTATAAPAVGLTPSELKLRVLAQYPDLFFCDPDQYPVAIADEAGRARERLPAIQADREVYTAIVKSLSLPETGTLNAEQSLAVYRLSKRMNAMQWRGDGSRYAFSLVVAPAGARQATAVEGAISADGVISETSRQPTIATCPICLPRGTLIATPAGDLPVESLHAGVVVWTAGLSGERIAAPVVRVSRTPVPAGHRLVRVRLADGRVVSTSPGHPAMDGRALGSLLAGDLLDGARVVSVALVPYDGEATYDLLPAGPTGAYWADGVLIGSTLR